ncbi:MAG: hypothetical protein R2784_09760 [Saprospiraceae bacterium]
MCCKIKPYNAAGVNETCPQKMFSVAPQAGLCTNMYFPQPGQTDVDIILVIGWGPVAYASGYKVNMGFTPNGGEIWNDGNIYFNFSNCKSVSSIRYDDLCKNNAIQCFRRSNGVASTASVPRLLHQLVQV